MLKRLGEVEIPLEQDKEFGRSTPLFVEIGFGNGSFIEQVASENPGLNCLGAEVSLSSLNRAFKRIRRSGLENVRLFRCDGRFLVQNLVGGQEIQRLAVNFPDPWPRTRHAKRRLLSSDFFSLASTRLTDDGKVCLATDDKNYFEFARDEARKSGLFSETITLPPAECLTTRYATKWLEQDRTINYVEFGLIDRAPGDGGQFLRGDMHHAFLKGQLPKITLEEKKIHRTEVGEIVILDVLHPEGADPGYVFVVLVEEEGLRQDILVDVRPHKDGFHLGLRRFGSPVLTQGVAEAVRLLTSMFEETGMEVVDTWF